MLWLSTFIHSSNFVIIVLLAEIGDFQKIVGTFIEVVDNVSKEVEKEKMKVLFVITINKINGKAKKMSYFRKSLKKN